VARARGREVLTAGELRTACRGVAGGLARVGVKPGEIVLLFLSHQAMLIPAFLGAQWLGAVPAYMPPLSPRQDRQAWLASHAAVIAHVRPRAIVADQEVAALLEPGPDVAVLTLEDLSGAEGPEAPAAFDPDAVCLLQHSSGTTGLKKGVQLSYGAVMAQIEAYGRALDLDGSETVVSWLPVYHDMGLIACTVLPTVRGLPLVSLDPFEWLVQPHVVLEEAAKADRSLVWLPNFAFNHLARHARRLGAEVRLDGVRALIDCSEPCRPESFDAMLAAYRDRGLGPDQLQTCYAMAETVFAATQSRLDEPVRRLARTVEGAERTLLSCGPALEGMAIEVRGPDGTALVQGEVGEIHLSGDSLFDGYFRQPDLTAERVKDGWYGSRDLGFIDDGELFVCGRLEDLIIVAGRNLYAHDIEAALASVEGLKPGRAAAFGVANEATGTEDLVVLAETAGPEDEARVSSLAEAVRLQLSQTLLVTPREVVVLTPDTLIKTTSGKTSRDENRRRYLAGELKSWRAGR
jgi:fatty-acyl-CoA synthase